MYRFITRENFLRNKYIIITSIVENTYRQYSLRTHSEYHNVANLRAYTVNFEKKNTPIIIYINPLIYIDLK